LLDEPALRVKVTGSADLIRAAMLPIVQITFLNTRKAPERT
jgi:hypothetical protein